MYIAAPGILVVTRRSDGRIETNFRTNGAKTLVLELEQGKENYAETATGQYSDARLLFSTNGEVTDCPECKGSGKCMRKEMPHSEPKQGVCGCCLGDGKAIILGTSFDSGNIEPKGVSK